MSASARLRRPPFVLFSDLDGTVLDAGYQPGPAREALARLDAVGVPVVFCSSKTRSEQEALRAELGIAGPFVVENGSAVYVPPPCPDLPVRGGLGVHVLGVSAGTCSEAAKALREPLELHFRGFSEMTVGEVAAATGLSRAAAERARKREFSETLVGLTDAHAGRLAEALAARGMRLLPGGRHHTVSGTGADKGAALRWLRDRLRAVREEPTLEAVAVGDSDNDVGMLAAADRSYLVARSDGCWPDAPGATRLTGVGPRGFAELAALLTGSERS